jgi:hypothetical protein
VNNRDSTYEAAKALQSQGWVVEKATVVAADGSRRQGYRWTSPDGTTSEVLGNWKNGPPKPKRVKVPPTWHMQFKRLNARTEIFLTATLPVPCPACGEPFPERSLVPYAGERCCLGCLLTRKTTGEREAYRRETFAGRARAYMESQLAIGRANAPEVMP